MSRSLVARQAREAAQRTDNAIDKGEEAGILAPNSNKIQVGLYTQKSLYEFVPRKRLHSAVSCSSNICSIL